VDVIIALCVLVKLSQNPFPFRVVGSQAACQYKLALFLFPYPAVDVNSPIYSLPGVKSPDLRDDWDFGVYMIFVEDAVYLPSAQFPVLLGKRVNKGRDYELGQRPACNNVVGC